MNMHENRPPTIDDVVRNKEATMPDEAATGRVDLKELLASCKAVQRTLRRGEYLFRGGEPFDSVFLIESGCVKKCAINSAAERVCGFRVPGELVGLDSMGHVCQVGDAKALCRSTVWVIPYIALLAACKRCPRLRERLTLAQAAGIRRQRCIEYIGRSYDAPQRVSLFVRDMSQRLPGRARHFLRRNRNDVARLLAVSGAEIARELSATVQARAFVSSLLQDAVPQREKKTGARPVFS